VSEAEGGVCRKIAIAGGLAVMSVALVSGQAASPQRPDTSSLQRPTANRPVSPASDVSRQRALLDQYCVTCHNEKLKTANLLLDKLDLASLGDHTEVAEKIVRKLRAGMMPPSGMPRPDPATREALIVWLEQELDRRAVTHLPPPGLHRLNRTEYANAIRDLLGLEVDATKFLPSDDSTYGFDNMAGALGMSPALLEAYLSAAGKISRLAIGSATVPTMTQYTVPAGLSQNYHIEGLPFGTRGGILIKHEFPADGEYVFKITPVSEGNMGQSNKAFGQVKGEKLEVTVDDELVKVFDWDEELGQGDGVRFGVPTPRIPVKAGLHTIGVSFLATNYAPDNSLNEPFSRATIETGGIAGFVFYPHVGIVRVEGPYDAKGADSTPSRRKIFVCRPTSEKDEERCARTIVSTLASRAFRRPASPQDVGTLMQFYQEGRNAGNFDAGIEAALQRLLADPEFVYRRETEPANLAPGKSYRVNDLALASRLSFFLWSSLPDAELLTLATQGKLKDPAVLEGQVRRLLADPRSEALIANFTGQWLNVRGMQVAEPVMLLYPDFDDNLRLAFRREMELFFDSIVREDRSILDLLTADYTFVDERLAKHYGIPNVYGSQFRRVTLGPALDMRRGLLGKGALLTITSQPSRTSPVGRGKWVMQTFLGVSPPDPPPNVPEIKAKKGDANAKEPTMRERMEQHRANPICSSCHKIFEPMGLALEYYDGIGKWRTTDEGVPIDGSGVLVDGTRVNDPASLRETLVRYSPQFVRVVTEKLLTYALGRGVEYSDMPLVRSIVRDASGTKYRFSSLVLGIVKSAPFQMNMKQPDNGQQAAR
jgi:mono/diheme cytochrome c family protein